MTPGVAGLQWGHVNEDVEEIEPSTHPLLHIEVLQWGHVNEDVEEQARGLGAFLGGPVGASMGPRQ